MKKRSTLDCFLGMLALSASVSLIYAAATHGQGLQNALYGHGDGYLMDFFNHVAYVGDLSHVYESSPHALFPPLAYLLYGLVRLILPVQGAVGHAAFRANYPSLLLYSAYASLLATAFALCVRRYLHRESTMKATIIALLLMVSNVFVEGLLERGNSVYVAAVLVLAAFALRDSDKVWKRELALICLAAAAGLKMYPALLGVFYLKEMRWKEAARLVVYGVALFAIPFVFCGGMDGFRQFMANQSEIAATVGNTWSASYLAQRMLARAGWTGTTLPTLAAIALALVCVAAAWRSRKAWQTALLLTSVMLFWPQANSFYIFAMLLLPLLLFLRDEPVPSVRNVLTTLLFAVIFLPMLALDYAQSERMSAICLYLLTGWQIIDSVRGRKSLAGSQGIGE